MGQRSMVAAFFVSCSEAFIFVSSEALDSVRKLTVHSP